MFLKNCLKSNTFGNWFYKPNIKPLKMNQQPVYRTLESVLTTFNNYKKSNGEGIHKLLAVYDQALINYNTNFDETAKKHPLIILEGLDGCGKSTITKKLSAKIGAIQWCTPPDSIKLLRNEFDNNLELRVAYYALGNYIAALEVAVVLKLQPVIMDRYWHSTCAYALAQSVYDNPAAMTMPPEGDRFYQWPNDLLKPDIVLFLDVAESIRLKRISERTEFTSQELLLKNSNEFRHNVITSYRLMVGPKVEFINASGFPKKVLQNLMDKIGNLIVSI